jgi:hypothetical protein
MAADCGFNHSFICFGTVFADGFALLDLFLANRVPPDRIVDNHAGFEASPQIQLPISPIAI